MEKIEVIVSSYAAEAKGIVTLELRRADGASLPRFTPGAHIDLFLPNGLVRQYSLLNDWRDSGCYQIGVARVANSRGGSAWVHEKLRQGTSISISAPRNNFPLAADHRKLFFVAGGIGITPILAMIRQCIAEQRDWELLYLARSRQRAAFCDELMGFDRNRIHLHFDDEQAGLCDFRSALRKLGGGVPVYCCGPAPVMEAVTGFAQEHPNNPAFVEWFAPPPDSGGGDRAAGSFAVKIGSSGREIEIGADRSILDVLEESGFCLPFSCREGMCRSCEVKVLEGEPEHRDYVLSAAEKAAGNCMMICVSRAKGASLTLDL
ncbi:PDR/VanB family oxidoreductase [Herbaspirillum autotrophicum]|uniref:PDR/VanB family oxidoreductase n=1 Tax=Herbaspirillum autotrophicum TaxID=180195 RepID=UPI00067B3777|nr:PDR/VanB family oxidoreductase [Herbaspirillum autotrophicum]